jgi:hypothetical protein
MPLSFVVLTTFPLILYAQWMSSRAPASTSNVWETLNLLQASAAECLSFFIYPVTFDPDVTPLMSNNQWWWQHNLPCQGVP